MKNIFRPVWVAVFMMAFVTGGCSSAYVGLSGNTMYSEGLADMAITPVSGLEAMAHGSYMSTIPTSDSSNNAGVKIRYAVYGDPHSGQVVKRHAHVIFAELIDKNRYELMAETFASPNEINLRKTTLDRRNWTEHTFFEMRQGDWFTELWDMNGYITPQVWFGKRWSRSYDMSSRIVVEYREPLPSCAKMQDEKLLGVFNNAKIDTDSPECRREIEAILQRADQAFSMRRPATISTSAPAPAEVFSLKPDRNMDLKRYVGEAVFMSKAMGKE